MEFQEKSFEDMLKEDRLKRLERQLKLQKIRGTVNQQLPSSPHMSVSGLSSIYGDQGTVSDFSFCAPTWSRGSSRAGSVVVASSINLRTELLKNLKEREKQTTVRVTSSEIDPRSDVDRSVKDRDREIMPPPLPPKKFSTQNDGADKILEQADVEVSNETPAKSLDSNSKQRSCRIFKNWTVRLNDRGQIVIKGRLESGELARSKAVKKRINATTVISVLNHHYLLVGDISDFKEELPEYVRGKFYNGFPTDWENVRQIWQCYIASGSSPRFRWPRPIADSDDDLRSDITEVAVSRSTRSSVLKTPVTNSRPVENFGQETTSGKKVAKKVDSLRERSTAIDSDLSSIHLPVNEDSSSGFKTSKSLTSAPNEKKRAIGEAGNRSSNRGIEATNGSTACANCGKLVPKRKIDAIAENLLNKNCSKEYIDKVIKAMDCLNELFSFSPTTNENPETPPDEGVSMNYNSNLQYDSTRDRLKSKSSRENISTESQKLRSMISNSNSYSLESSDQSENESAVIRNKINDSTRRCSVQLSQLPHKNSVASATSQSSERFVDGISKHGDNRKFNAELTAAVEAGARKYGNRIDHNRRGGIVYDTSLSGVEALQSSEAIPPVARNGLPPIADLNSRQIIEPPTRSTLSKKAFGAEGESHDHGDSDISIIDGHAGSTTKSKIQSDKKKRIFVNEKDAGDSRPGSLYSDKTPKPRTRESISDSSLQTPTNRSIKNIAAQNDCRTPSKLEKATPTRRKAAETSRRNENSVDSDSENVSLRMSSRGRRILPPLNYWNGERAVLRDQELVYTPGTPLTGSVSLEISQQSINLGASNLTPITTSVNNLKQTKKDTVNQSKSGTKRRTRNRRNEKILREITDNRETISDNGMTSGNKSISGRSRKIEKYVTSSSEEDTPASVIKKRRFVN